MAHRPSSFVPPEILQRELSNGLEVYLLPERSSPVFTYQVWFRVGSAHELAGRGGKPGNTGLSHFFEHLMFRGTPSTPDYFAAVYERGGRVNAWTWYDATCYWDKLPAGNLGFVVALEADRLANIRLDLATLEREREVVRNERLLRSVNDPSGAIDERLHTRAFTCSPYRWPVIGWPQDLISVTPAQAEEYFRAHYGPGNCYVVLVGDFDPEEALRELEAAYGALPRVSAPPRASSPEPPQSAERRDFVEKATSSGHFQMAFKAPAAAEDDFLVLQVIDALLCRGKSSRLQRALIYGDDAVATRVSGAAPQMREPYLYSFEVGVAPGRSNREVEQRMDAVFARLRDEPVEQAELDRAVRGMRADLVRSGLDTQGKADLLGFSLLVSGRPGVFYERLQRAAELVPADIQRVAARVLRPATRTIVAAVNPRRLPDLCQAWADAAPSATSPLRASLAAAVQLLAQGKELDLERERLAEEDQALTLLRGRIDAALAAGTRAEDLSDAEKGLAQRREQLQVAQGHLTEAAASYETRRATLAAAALPAQADPASPLGALLAAALGGAALPERAPLSADSAGADAAVALLIWARLAQGAGQSGHARAALEEVLALPAAPDPLLGAAQDLAWELRVY